MTISIHSHIVAPDEGPVWDMEPGRPAIFKLLSEQTGDSVAIFEEIVPVGSGTPFHIHHTSDEVIYIFEGEFTFKIGEQMVNRGAGAWIFIPRGVAHAWKNSGRGPGRACYIFTPAEGAKVFEELRLLQLPMPAIEPATLEMTCRRYGYEMVGPPL